MPVNKCVFCGLEVENFHNQEARVYYKCRKCGIIRLTEEAYEDYRSGGYPESEKNKISIVLRNEYEMMNHRTPNKYLTHNDLEMIIDQYSPLDPLAKMDMALINIAKASKHIGHLVNTNPSFDYPYYHCLNAGEFIHILLFLFQEGFIGCESQTFQNDKVYITAKGYQRLREIEKPRRNSNKCFVAIWFTPDMDKVYEKAIKPAIEFKEYGESLPRFEAIKIDNLEHINDINDEIIAQIRRSRFMVCDLTGYRGGVYFEAGFAYGLGLDVIYTCREDWSKEEKLKDKKGKEIEILYDKNGNEISVRKEGVHFDLAHRNRIEWSPAKLDDFRKKLQDRIKAIIV